MLVERYRAPYRTKPRRPHRRDPKVRLGFTNGCFDGLHQGHRFFLNACMAQCKILVVCLNSDAYCRSKGEGRPLQGVFKRYRNIQKSDWRDHNTTITMQEFHDDPSDWIRYYHPDVLFVGEEYRDRTILGRDLVPEVVFIPRLDGYSTTSLVEEIRNAKALRRPVSWSVP